MRVVPQVLSDVAAVGAAAADIVVRRLVGQPGDRPFLLGCPGGRSARSTYAALAARAVDQQLDLRRLVIVMMDEYVVPGPDGSLVCEGPHALHSCRRFGRVEIADRINAGLPRSHRISDDHLLLPDPADPAAYDAQLRQLGGIDVFLLASGASDGHVAFNPPGSCEDAGTRVVELPETTRRDNLATFRSFGGDLTAVPSHGVTVGPATIRDLSREVVMVAVGEDKRLAAARIAGATAYEADWPATILADCRNPHLLLDEAAAAEQTTPLTPDSH